MIYDPQNSDYIIYQGATFEETITVQSTMKVPVNLTGANGRMMLIDTKKPFPVIIELNSTNRRVILTEPIQGIFKIRIESFDTYLLNFNKGSYDLFLDLPNGNTIKVAYGYIEFVKSATIMSEETLQELRDLYDSINNPTEAPTEPVTESPTEPVTESPTEPVTESPTEPVTESPTEPVTESPTEPVTESPTEPVTGA